MMSPRLRRAAQRARAAFERESRRPVPNLVRVRRAMAALERANAALAAEQERLYARLEFEVLHDRLLDAMVRLHERTGPPADLWQRLHELEAALRSLFAGVAS